MIRCAASKRDDRPPQCTLRPIPSRSLVQAQAQTQLVAQLTAREVVKACGRASQPNNPDTCIILTAGADPRKLQIKAGVIRWNFQRALVGALEGERVTASCGNVLCVRPDHLRVSHRRRRTRTRAERSDNECAVRWRTIDG